MGNLLKNNVIKWAKLNSSPTVTFYDTETTGLSDEDEIVDIAIVDIDGSVLIDTLVKPSKLIPSEATYIHNITNKMVEYAPGWKEVWPRVSRAMRTRSGAYNLGRFYTSQTQTSVLPLTVARTCWYNMINRINEPYEFVKLSP